MDPPRTPAGEARTSPQLQVRGSPLERPARLGGSYRIGAPRCRGFTLTEALVVVAIIGTLSAIAFPPMFRALKRTENNKAQNDIRAIEVMIFQYQLENGGYPDSLSDLGAPIPLDPWGNPYQYVKIAGAGNKKKGHWRKDRFLVPLNSDFDLYSKGPDGKSSPPLTAEASRDDIVRAANGTFVGVAEEY